MAKYMMAFDAGTTSNRCILFDRQGRICSSAQKEFTQIFPKPGWVEHDAREIWATQLGVAAEAMGKLGASAADIAAIGITNQRETTVVWDKATGELIEDQAGRGFWVDFYEDGSPKSEDDIVIPKGFTIRASRLGILRCGLLPVEEESRYS